MLKALKEKRIKNPIGFEFFVPPPDDILEMIADSIPRFNIEMSPESHDEALRRFFGRPYGNDELERMIDKALGLGCERIDLFYIIGIPKQDTNSVKGTVEYCRELYKRFAHTTKDSFYLFPHMRHLLILAAKHMKIRKSSGTRYITKRFRIIGGPWSSQAGSTSSAMKQNG